MSAALIAELRARLRDGSPDVARLRADTAERNRIDQEVRNQAADDQAQNQGGGGGCSPSDALRSTLRRKLASTAIRVRADGTPERGADFQGGSGHA